MTIENATEYEAALRRDLSRVFSAVTSSAATQSLADTTLDHLIVGALHQLDSSSVELDAQVTSLEDKPAAQQELGWVAAREGRLQELEALNDLMVGTEGQDGLIKRAEDWYPTPDSAQSNFFA